MNVIDGRFLKMSDPFFSLRRYPSSSNTPQSAVNPSCQQQQQQRTDNFRRHGQGRPKRSSLRSAWARAGFLFGRRVCDQGQQFKQSAEDGPVADDNRPFHMSSQNGYYHSAEKEKCSEYLMSGAISARAFDSNAADTVTDGANTHPGMDTASVCEKIHIKTAKKAHERDLRELRQRLERKIAAAAAQAMNGRHEFGEGERRRKWLLGTATPQEKLGNQETRLFTVNSDDKITMRGANPRTGVISPSNRTESSQEDIVPHRTYRQKWKMQDDQWVSVDVSPTPSAQMPPNMSMEGQGSHRSKDTSSPMPVPGVLPDDWEDKFVVHMPSAKEPNPPTMTPEQIQEYQEIIGRASLERGKKQETGSGLNQRAVTPEDASTQTQTQGKNSGWNSSLRADQRPSVSPPSVVGRYFSPDEVGRDRVSPIEEDSHQKSKNLYESIRDGCFLGCMEIDQPCAKNPDEILLFPNMDDDCPYSPLPSTPTSKKAVGKKAKRLSEFEKAVVTEESPPSRCTRPPLSSNQRTASAPQKSNVQASLAQRAGTLHIQPSLASTPNGSPKSTATGKENVVEEVNRKNDDDVFIVTPTITRIMIPPSIPKTMTEPSRLRQPQRAAGMPRAPPPPKPGTHVSPGHPNLPFRGPPKTAPASEYPAIKHENSIHQGPATSSTTPRYPHMTATTATEAKKGTVTGKQFTIVTETCVVPAQKNDDHPKLDTHDIFRDVPAATGPGTQEIVSPVEERARNNFRTRRSKVPSVAELDGLQVHQQMGGVKVSDGPSNQAEHSPQEGKGEKENDSASPGNNKTHSIRVKIKRPTTQSDIAKLAEKRAEAKKAAERLAAARKHAERLAEARAAYKKAEAQKAANQEVLLKTAADRLKERKIAAEKLAEAQAAYREAEAKKAAKKAEEKNAEKNAEVKTAGGKNAVDEKKEKQATERKTEAQKRAEEKASPPPNPCFERQNPENSTADEHQGEGKGESDGAVTSCSSDGGLSVQTCFLLFHIMLLSFVQLHGLLRRRRMFHYFVVVSSKLFEMTSHCLRVSQRLCEAWLTYRRTGSWPEPSSDELTLLMRDVGQAGVYFVVLGFVVMIVGRAAGYIVVVASWIVWFSRPFGWVFGRLGGALFA
ncbi:hypothetical protein VTN77DRAFT_7409 [Rasamsonia byssochlamydoides]|uniref:uncharacterized protein n=1 Tax=Rasamsonia byssochlamydoides TaxID=89139 RepID=UPI0037436688